MSDFAEENAQNEVLSELGLSFDARHFRNDRRAMSPFPSSTFRAFTLGPDDSLATMDLAALRRLVDESHDSQKDAALRRLMLVTHASCGALEALTIFAERYDAFRASKSFDAACLYACGFAVELDRFDLAANLAMRCVVVAANSRAYWLVSQAALLGAHASVCLKKSRAAKRFLRFARTGSAVSWLGRGPDITPSSIEAALAELHPLKRLKRWFQARAETLLAVSLRRGS